MVQVCLLSLAWTFSLRSMASMLCTQWMPRLRMALLPPMWVLPNRLPGLRSSFTHKNRTDKPTNPRVSNASFNIFR
ncbi:MAG: hypothetical protein IIU92_06550 [Bacteroidaceae bacterium]|nr:hypothetical protein [Bacteroidaceae bacterium]